MSSQFVIEIPALLMERAVAGHPYAKDPSDLLETMWADHKWSRKDLLELAAKAKQRRNFDAAKEFERAAQGHLNAMESITWEQDFRRKHNIDY